MFIKKSTLFFLLLILSFELFPSLCRAAQSLTLVSDVQKYPILAYTPKKVLQWILPHVTTLMQEQKITAFLYKNDGEVIKLLSLIYCGKGYGGSLFDVAQASLFDLGVLFVCDGL